MSLSVKQKQTHRLLHLEWMNNKDLLCSTGNHIQYPEINHNGKEYKKECIGASLVVQWVGLHAPNTGGPGLIPGRGTGSHMHVATKSLHVATKNSHATTKSSHAATKIPCAATKTQHSQNK